jgi:hypothetical protein
MKLDSAHVESVLALGAVVLILFACYRLIGVASVVFLLFFDFLFVSFVLRLNGMHTRKCGLLVLGNVAGFLWFYLLTMIGDFGDDYGGATFTAFFGILFPFLGSLWLVSLWSLCLSALQDQKGKST